MIKKRHTYLLTILKSAARSKWLFRIGLKNVMRTHTYRILV